MLWFRKLSQRAATSLCALLFLAVNAAKAEDPLRVGYSQFPPFSSTSQTGVAEGYSIDIIRMLLEPKGYTLQFVPYNNPAEMLEALANNEISLTSILVDNEERRRFGNFTDVVAEIDLRVFVAAGTEPPMSVEDLRGLRIGAAAGSANIRILSEIEGVIAVPFESASNLLLPLLAGEVDGIANSLESMSFLSNQTGLSQRISATTISLRKTPVSLLVDPRRPALLNDLNVSIAAARTAGDFDDLYNSWFAVQPVPFTVRERYVVMGALSLAALVLLYWLRLHYIVLKRARTMEARSALLAATLDATGLSLAIFDEEMRPVHWNDAFRQNYPKQVPLLEGGENMETLIAAAFQNGSLGAPLCSQDAKAEAKRRIDMLLAGGEVESLNHTEGGRVLRRLTKMLPNRHFATITADVTELVEVQNGLEIARAELEGANQKLVEFNRIAAHDLVAPLRNMRNLHCWIRDDIEEAGLELDEDTKENFKIIDKLLKRQSKMIEDLLAFSYSGVAKTAEDFDPTERFISIVELSNIPPGFSITLPASVPKLHANPVAFDIVMRNLISNAVKHHDRTRGRVDIEVEVSARNCLFKIHDDGPGIPEDALAKVFEPFTRLKSRDEGAGSGLGLAFIKRRVEEWGGNVWARAVDGERGTSILFEIPLADCQTTFDAAIAS